MKKHIGFLIVTTAIVHLAYADCGNLDNQKIQAIIDADRAKYNIPAVELSVTCPDEKTSRDFVSGTTTMNGNVPLSPNNLFQIGSETKSFVAVILLQLEAEQANQPNGLKITDPISKYAQYLPNDLPASWSNMTIQQLLSHTSGIPNYIETPGFTDEIMRNDPSHFYSPEELIKRAQARPLKPSPVWYYSNTDTVILGLIIEGLTGHNLAEELKLRFFVPLQMTNTHYLPVTQYSDDILKQMAHGYALDNRPSPIDITDYNISWANAAGAVISTSHDNAIWLKALLIDHKLLPEKQQNEMMTLVDPNTGLPLTDSIKKGIGLEVWHETKPVIGEIWYRGGASLGYLAKMVWLKSYNIGLTQLTDTDDDNQTGGYAAIFNDVTAYIANSASRD